MANISVRCFSEALKRNVHFEMYLPNDKPDEQGRKMKTLFLLHGYAGDAGIWVPEHIAQKYNIAVVAPNGENGFWLDGLSTGHKYCTFVGVELVDYLRRTFGLAKSADETCIIGLSMGGFGTWVMGITYPNYFSAMAPICGGGMYWNAARLKDLPIWAFHGALDDTVLPEESIHMVAAVNRNGGNAKITVYPDVAHASWVNAYADDAMWEWMFSQKR